MSATSDAAELPAPLDLDAVHVRVTGHDGGDLVALGRNVAIVIVGPDGETIARATRAFFDDREARIYLLPAWREAPALILASSSGTRARTRSAVTLRPSSSTPLGERIHCHTCERLISAVAASSIRL